MMVAFRVDFEDVPSEFRLLQRKIVIPYRSNSGMVLFDHEQRLLYTCQRSQRRRCKSVPSAEVFAAVILVNSASETEARNRRITQQVHDMPRCRRTCTTTRILQTHGSDSETNDRRRCAPAQSMARIVMACTCSTLRR